jgi:polar amino acid transport system substrate-binding protein
MLKYLSSLCYAVALIAVVSTPSSAAYKLDEIKKRGTIIVGIDFAHPPFGGINDKAEQIGSDLDTAQLLAKDLGVKLETVNVSGPNRIPLLVTNKVDVIVASMSVTAERLKVIDISDPYGVVPLNVSGPKNDKITRPSDLQGKSIAVASGVTADIELVRVTKDIPNVSIVRYADEATTKTAILTGQQKYLASTLSDLAVIKDQSKGLDLDFKFTMKTYPMGVGVHKGEPELLGWINGWVQENLKNGKLNTIFVKWYGQPLPTDMKNFD